MTLKATRFTPKILLGSPRRGNAVPNSDASIILYSSSRYDFTRHEEISWIEALDVKSGTTKVVDSNKQSKHPVWIDDQAVAVVRSTEGGETDVVISESGCFDDRSVLKLFLESCLAALALAVEQYLVITANQPCTKIPTVPEDLSSDVYIRMRLVYDAVLNNAAI